MTLDDDAFAQLITGAVDSLPQEYLRNLRNVALTYADDPTPEQRHQQKLRPHQTLFGLYEGVPQTERGAGYSFVLPDKITLFKNPLLAASRDMNELRANIRHTLWHEIAHHFGLDHDRIHELEDKDKDQT